MCHIFEEKEETPPKSNEILMKIQPSDSAYQ